MVIIVSVVVITTPYSLILMFNDVVDVVEA
jgi:hypothetical protein